MTRTTALPTVPRLAPQLLIAQDSHPYAAALCADLAVAGFRADVARDGLAALACIRSSWPSLVLLDVLFSGRDGYDLLRRIRDEGHRVPILVLTSRRDECDKLRAFALGADDYVTTPVSVLELIARIRAILRRAQPADAEEPTWLRFGDVEFHPPTRRVRRLGRAVTLRPKEFDLLAALFRQRGRVVSRDALLRNVWGYSATTVTRTIDTHIAVLRRKLEADPKRPEHIVTIRSSGYILTQQG
jgi:DNA-binding response OmpR family regulator